jgi:glycosyltransferase involved in cell wall biosynthesis
MVELARFRKTESFTIVKTKTVTAIPCYNTQKSIAEVIKRTKRYVDEVIIIDDGSSDMTAEIARAEGATVVSHDTNKGYGAAIKSCFVAARKTGADVLVTIDGDGQHNPDEIPRLLDPIIKEGADLVIGSRFIGKEGKIPIYRIFGIWLITFLWNFGNKVKVSDTQSGFRAYGKKAIQGLEFSDQGMSVSIEILENIRKMKSNIKDVPITCSYENNNRTLNMKALRHGMGVTLSVIRIRFSSHFAKQS